MRTRPQQERLRLVNVIPREPVAWLFLLLVSAGCSQLGRSDPRRQEPITLRVGIGQVASGTPLAGLEQLRHMLTSEALVTSSVDGRPAPWLAEGWTTDVDGSTLRIRLRSNVSFSDGSPLDAPTVVQVLLSSLPTTMGSAYGDIHTIRIVDDGLIEIRFRQASPFVLEALQLQMIQMPTETPRGTGPFVDFVKDGSNELRANAGYYLGRPAIDRVVVNVYPSIRAAWTDLLRDRLDMLYEVGSDALDSLENAKQVAVFKYTRNYQFVLAFNPQTPTFRSATVRRALNMAIDRESIIRDAFDGRAEPSWGPVSPRHWAFTEQARGTSYDPRTAATILRSSTGQRSVRFVCLVPPDSERIALVVKRQLQAVGVEMDVREVTPNEFIQALMTSRFEAVLTEFASGPTLFSIYGVWHSRGPLVGRLGNPSLDAALDHIRHASNDDEYRAGVADVQRAVVEDPPGIFLAWSQRARAVSRRFDVPAEPDLDILGTLRLWRPATPKHAASRQRN